MAGKVYSYMRFSDPRQSEGHSSERQMAYAAKWAAENNLTLDATLSLRDEGLSAYHQRHIKAGALGTFLQAVESGKVAPGSVLVVEGLDRLSRAEPIQAQAQLSQIITAGITVVTASDGKKYSRQHLKANPMDLVYSLLVMIRAHEESDTKSKRVKASIKKQCRDWIEGKYRGLIRNGHDPAWVRIVDGKYELVPEQAAAVRMALALYTEGYGAKEIFAKLEQAGHKLIHGKTTHNKTHIYKIIANRMLLGEKELTIDGETFVLKDYYPALVTDLEWADLRNTAATRNKSKLKGEIPNVIAGLGITVCGYCGSPMSGQTSYRKPRLADGRVSDTYRRLRCSHTMYNIACPGGNGSCSVGPVERAIMNYCSDMMNLRALHSGDRAAKPAAELAEANRLKAEVDDKLEKLTDAMLASEGSAIATFVNRARDLEKQSQELQQRILALENELSANARTSIEGFDKQWRELAAGVEAQDYEARMKARRLVQLTFEKLTVYTKGMRPSETPPGYIDLTMVAKGGSSRHIRIDENGKWTEGLNIARTADPQ